MIDELRVDGLWCLQFLAVGRSKQSLGVVMDF